MKKKYYKVVFSHRDEMGSATLVGKNVNYKVGEWVSAPKNTRLFVFDNKKQAETFAMGPNHFIYECQIIGGIRGQGCSIARLKAHFWKQINSILQQKKKVDFDKLKIPLFGSACVLAKKVKLIKKI